MSGTSNGFWWGSVSIVHVNVRVGEAWATPQQHQGFIPRLAVPRGRKKLCPNLRFTREVDSFLLHSIFSLFLSSLHHVKGNIDSPLNFTMESISNVFQNIPQALQWGLAGIGALVLGSKLFSYLQLVLSAFVLGGTNVCLHIFLFSIT